jgi:hypothetical protein
VDVVSKSDELLFRAMRANCQVVSVNRIVATETEKSMISSRIQKTVILLSLLIVSCTEQRATGPVAVDQRLPSAPSGVVASNASTTSVAGAGVARSNGITYVSAAPGTFIGATTVRIRNRTSNGAAVTVQAVDGGFDPVGILAEAGDEVMLETPGLPANTPMAVSVPPRRPPKIVRTSPSKGRIDVALSVQIEIIFSEPVLRGSVFSGGIVLSSPAGGVPGHIDVSADGIKAVFIPDIELTPGTTYSLVIKATITDLDGDPLEGEETTTFTTVPQPPGPFTPGSIAFVSSRDGNREIYSSETDGSGVVRLTKNPGYDGELAWSPDGNRIAYVSASTNEDWPTATHDIYIMNADGSGRTRLTTTGFAAHPSWSPNGREIAYSYKNGGWPDSKGDIAIIDVEKGESSTTYLGLSSMGAAQPTWFPDGTRIAFLAEPGYYDWWSQVNSIKPDGTAMETLVADGNRRFSSVTFSPDGARFSFNYCDGNDALVACLGASGIAVGSYASRVISYFPKRNPGSYWYAQWNATWSPDGNVLSFSRRDCSGCAAKVGYSTIDGVDTGPVIDGSWDPVWRPKT